MTLALAGVKSNPSTSYPISAATLSSSALELANGYTSGAQLSKKESVKRLPSQRGRGRRVGVRSQPHVQVRSVPRTIIS